MLLGVQWGLNHLHESARDEHERDGVVRFALGVGLLLLIAAPILGGGALGTWQMLGLAAFAGCYLTLARTHDALLTVTTLFGLIHGFGFAGVLMEIGLPADRIFGSLLAFNLGIELGQLLFVGALCAMIPLARRLFSRTFQVHAAAGAASLLCALGTFWFVERVL
ncbi:MAG: HupE/UreJ family protein [Gammaproteobacteria bacterium AqS3]|nr:HupE/UreJ family protein [Gammaproteobacteria bacterium AqS3]